MVAPNTGCTVTCSRLKLAYYNLKLYELEIPVYDLIVAKLALKIYVTVTAVKAFLLTVYLPSWKFLYRTYLLIREESIL